MSSTPTSEVGRTIASYRAKSGHIVAILIRLVGNFDIAEEAAPGAFAAAP